MARCSFCCFICGRIMTKYSTTNISTSGSMLMRDDIMPPPPAAAGAVWAKAEEMNTGTPGRDSCRAMRHTHAAHGVARGRCAEELGIVCRAASARPRRSRRPRRRTPRAGLQAAWRARARGSCHCAHAGSPSCDAGGGQVALLDVAVALDLLRECARSPRASAWLPAFRPASTSLDAGAVLADQRALGAALLGAAEHVQRRAAQALEPRQHAEAGQHGRARTCAFAARPCRCVLAMQRRRQVVVELEVAFEHRADLAPGSRCRCAGAPPRTRPCRPSA